VVEWETVRMRPGIKARLDVTPEFPIGPEGCKSVVAVIAPLALRPVSWPCTRPRNLRRGSW
jgi:hypothetical protein